MHRGCAAEFDSWIVRAITEVWPCHLVRYGCVVNGPEQGVDECRRIAAHEWYEPLIKLVTTTPGADARDEPIKTLRPETETHFLSATPRFLSRRLRIAL